MLQAARNTPHFRQIRERSAAAPLRADPGDDEPIAVVHESHPQPSVPLLLRGRPPHAREDRPLSRCRLLGANNSLLNGMLSPQPDTSRSRC